MKNLRPFFPQVVILILLTCPALSIYAQSPGGVNTNLGIWLKANDNGGVVTDGTIMTSWTDKSGNGSNLTAAHAPTYVANGINFNPAILLQNNDNFNVNIPSIDARNTAIYVVGKPTSTGGTGSADDYRPLWASKMNTLAGFDPTDVPFYLQPGGLTGYYNSVNGSYLTTPSLVWAPNEVSFFREELSNASPYNVTYTKAGNSSNAQTISAANPGAPVPNYFASLGNWPNSNYQEPFGYIAETFIYSSASQSTSDKNKIESYLALKYGITLDQTTAQNYVNSSGTIVWDASANATYHNNIFGIAMDNASGLDQRVSASVNAAGIIAIANGSSFFEVQAANTALTDLNAMVVGDDNGATSFGNFLTTTKDRMSRIWKVQETGTVGMVTIRVPISIFSASNPQLIRSTDALFDASDDLINPASSDAIYYYFNIDFNNGDIFSFIENALASSSPGGINSNLGLWLKANDNGGVVTDGTTMTLWTDKSVNGFNLTAAHAPTYTANAINFNPTILLQNNDKFYVNTPSIDTRNTTIYVVGKPVMSSDNYNELWSTNVNDATDPSTNVNVPFYIVPFNDLGYFNHDNQSYPATTLTWAPDEISLVREELSDAAPYNITYTKLGDYTNSQTLNAVDPGASTPNYFSTLGNWPQDNYQESFGHIAETIIYSSASQSASDKNKIESYLALKYGITLAQTTPQNYVNSGGTILWDAGANSTYSNNIFGVARDNTSTLDQRVSASVNAAGIIAIANGSSFSEVQAANTALTDLNAMVVGDDNGATTFDVLFSASAPVKDRMTRIWKVQETGTVGTVTIRVPRSNFAATNPNPQLVRSTNAVFDASDNQINPTNSDGTYYYFNIDFNNGDFFSFIENASVTRPFFGPGGVGVALSAWLTTDYNGGVNTDGTIMTAWTDKSPNPVNLTGANNPIYKANVINYNPAAFLQNDDKFYYSNPFLPVKGTTLYVVGKPGVGDGGGDNELWSAVSYSPTTANINGGDIMVYPVRGIVEYFGNDDYPSTLSWQQNENSLFRAEYSNSSNKNYNMTIAKLGGVSQTIPVVSQSTTANYTILGNWGTSAYHEPFGYIAETFVYSSITQTPADKNRIESYLAMKYGLTLDPAGPSAGNYVLSDGTTVWNASANSTYHNSVTGLVRDDSSALYQKQSTTPDGKLNIYLGSLAASNPANTSTITNNKSALIIGQTTDAYNAANNTASMPTGIQSRFQRQFKITNTNFADSYSIEFKWDSVGTFNISDIRLLVDDDGDFSNATVILPTQVNYSLGSIIVSGITPAIIPNGDNFVTIGSINKITTPLSSLSVLPVNLLSFTAVPNNCNVVLSWTSASEINFNRYDIQYSNDGTNFITVGTVTGRGDNSNYTFTYQPADVKGWYRLDMIDKDGKAIYSQILLANTGCTDGIKPYFWPNPVSSALTLGGLGIGAKKIQVYSADGKELYNFLTADAQTTVDVHAWAAGVYNVHIVFDNGKVITEKFVKQ